MQVIVRVRDQPVSELWGGAKIDPYYYNGGILLLLYSWQQSQQLSYQNNQDMRIISGPQVSFFYYLTRATHKGLLSHSSVSDEGFCSQFSAPGRSDICEIIWHVSMWQIVHLQSRACLICIPFGHTHTMLLDINACLHSCFTAQASHGPLDPMERKFCVTSSFNHAYWFLSYEFANVSLLLPFGKQSRKTLTVYIRKMIWSIN